MVWGLPRCVWARESTAPAQGNQSLSRELRASALCPGLDVQLFATPWTATHQASLSFTISQSLFKLMSTELVMPYNHLILCCPLLLLLSIFPSVSPSNEHEGLISFRMDWLDLLAVQGTLKSILHHHSLKTSILQYLAFFMVQLLHP